MSLNLSLSWHQPCTRWGPYKVRPCGAGIQFGLVYWGLTPQQQPGSYQGGEMVMMMMVMMLMMMMAMTMMATMMMMMKSVFIIIISPP